MIDNLSALKTHAVFSKLAKLQSLLDTKDKAMSETSFTRSPYQVLSFLVTYAGLNSTDRSYVIEHLPKEADLSISKEELDKLIEEINWPTLILNKSSGSALNFELQIGIYNTDLFDEEMKKHAPKGLLDALKNKDCMVKIERTDCVVFTTKVDQNVSWKQPLDREADSSYFTAPQFLLSEALKQKIAGLSQGQSWASWSNGGIHIKKGNSEKQELHIVAPNSTNEYKSEVKDLEVDPGIYDAYKDLKNFYGLDRVDKVKVKLSNTATFSDKGATASQTQVVTYLCESAAFNNQKDEPTVITVHGPLNVYYQGIDVLASLGDGEKSFIDPRLDPTEYYITLPVKEDQAGIRLYPTQLTPSQVHEVNFNSSDLKTASSTSSGSLSSSSSSKPLSSSGKNPTQDPASSNYSFLFKMGMAFSALTAIAAIVIVALALTSIIALPYAAVGGIAAVGVAAAVIGLVGFFSSGKEKPAKDELRQESSATASASV